MTVRSPESLTLRVIRCGADAGLGQPPDRDLQVPSYRPGQAVSSVFLRLAPHHRHHLHARSKQAHRRAGRPAPAQPGPARRPPAPPPRAAAVFPPGPPTAPGTLPAARRHGTRPPAPAPVPARPVHPGTPPTRQTSCAGPHRAGHRVRRQPPRHHRPAPWNTADPSCPCRGRPITPPPGGAFPAPRRQPITRAGPAAASPSPQCPLNRRPAASGGPSTAAARLPGNPAAGNARTGSPRPEDNRQVTSPAGRAAQPRGGSPSVAVRGNADGPHRPS
jgi:hypothetical protein